MSVASAFPHVRTSLVESEVDKLLPTGGYRSAGHFASDLVRALGQGPDPDALRRVDAWRDLVKRGASGLNETSDPDGGVLVPTALSKAYWDRSLDFDNLAGRFAMLPLADGSRLVIPAVAERSRATGSRNGGLVGYWEAEAAQRTPSMPKLRGMELRLKKLTVKVPVTVEVFEDSAGAVELLLDGAAPAEIAFKVNEALISGTGAGVPLGILNAEALITVDAVAAQGAGTITATNIGAMWKRCFGPSRRRAVWLANADTAEQLSPLFDSPPAFGSPSPTIKGRPVVEVEACPTLGTTGDLILADLTQYVGLVRSGGVRRSVSMHLRFDYDELVFAYTLRCDFQPYWDAPLTPFKGSATTSPFVALSGSRT